ncbi:hypothetical protein [Phaeodactylibacter sp.]|uniref:hypothetical protein n=1 Tax=Phaeodactylibacter sp. TaxID=1940289 RepID=UPI0025D7EF74|nr:hypothetical protein [Phaeodactylibacter sp.]MCI4651284.1 hypothetical protein [Phaeodactylibacter sp.]MCI5092469.1 hypothetical protein [Phaeodactylibacter sp.]
MKTINFLLTCLFATLFLATLSNCGYEANEGTTNQTVAEAADTISPPADETDGADNVQGYHTVQMSTVYKDLIPVPEAVMEGENTYAAYYPGEAVFDFSPDRYVFRYLIPDKDVDVEILNQQTRQPPLFKTSCARAEVPLECSNSAYLAYNEAQATPLNRTVYAYVTVNENGELERIDHIQPANNAACSQCRARAQAFLDNLPKWEPASFNGSAVKAQLILPVKI